MLVSISTVINVVLSLFLLFQWYKNHAREEAVKNGVLAVHAMIERLSDPRAQDILDSLDGTLATLGRRHPFIRWGDTLILSISTRFKAREASPRSFVSL